MYTEIQQIYAQHIEDCFDLKLAIEDKVADVRALAQTVKVRHLTNKHHKNVADLHGMNI